MIHQSDWKLLCTLYEHKSVTRAAQALYIAQPAVTRRLGQLEEEFGVAIAVRHSKGLLFTPEGEFLVEHAAKMVREYESLENRLHAQGGKPFGTLHIASSASLARFLLPRLLGGFKREYPNVEFQLSSEYSYKVTQMVNTNRAHVGFLRGDYESGCERVLIGRKQGVVASNRPFELEELPNMPRIDFYADAAANAMIDAWWYDRFRDPPRTAVTVTSGSTCAEMVENGLGYGIFLTDEFLRGRDRLYRLEMRRADHSPVERRDWMIFREEFTQMRLVRAFIDYAQDYIKKGNAD